MARSSTEKIRIGIEKYQYLRQRLFAVDVSADRDFQRAFNGFFRMGRRSETYYIDFYCYLEQHKSSGVSFRRRWNISMKNTADWKCPL